MRDELLEQFLESHPEYRTMAAELAEARKQIETLRTACECAVMQLDATAAPIEDMADRIGSQAWRDLANGCRKQSDVISRALSATAPAGERT